MGDFQHGGENPWHRLLLVYGSQRAVGAGREGAWPWGKWTLLGEKAASLGHI